MKTEIIVFLFLLAGWVSCFALYHIVNYLWSMKSKPFNYELRFGKVFFDGSKTESGSISFIKSKKTVKTSTYPTSEPFWVECDVCRYKAYFKEYYIGIYDTELEAVKAIYEKSKQWK